jgi:hypothetical protein
MIEKLDLDKIPACILNIDALLIKSLLLAFFILNSSFISNHDHQCLKLFDS